VAPYLHTFLILCRCLSADESEAATGVLKQALLRDDFDWEQLIMVAERERLLPALWSCLKRKRLAQDLPPARRMDLKKRYAMNAILNGQIKKEVAEVVALLNERDVVPIMLKGGVYLFDPSLGDSGARVMRDIDMLIEERDFDRSIEALFEFGYRIKEGEDTEWTYCYPPLVKEGTLTPLEIHKFVGQQTQILPPADAWRDARAVEGQGLRLKVLSPTHQVLLNIFHSEISDRGFELGLLWLRQLRDLVDLIQRHEKAIDWALLDEMAGRHGLDHVVRSRLFAAHRLLGLTLPADRRIGLVPRLHFLKCELLLRWSFAQSTVRLWGAVTAPFKRHHIALTYDVRLDPITINLYRVKHLRHILAKYRGQIFARAMQRRHYDH